MKQRAIRQLMLAVWLAWGSGPGSAVAVESPRLVITDLKVPSTLSAREKSVLQQLGLVRVLREQLVESHSFRVLVRENESVQAILRERNIQQSPLAREGKDDKLGLDSAEYFLEPTLQAFSIRTRYEKMDMLPGMYERSDSASLQLVVRVFDGGGNTVFEQTAQGSARYPTIEANEEDKARSALRETGPILKAAMSMTQDVIDAIMARINPITVVDVQPSVFVIDRGRNSGFDKNTQFVVYGPTRKVPHPNRGDEITIPGARIGDARLSALYEEVAELKLTNGDAGKLTAGCIVRIVKE